MRTAIFVYEMTTVGIETNDDYLQLIQLETSTAISLSRFNQLTLGAGVYKIVSSRAVSVTADATRAYVEATTNDKDEFPEPKPRLLSGPLSETAITTVQGFFAVPGARGLEHV